MQEKEINTESLHFKFVNWYNNYTTQPITKNMPSSSCGYMSLLIWSIASFLMGGFIGRLIIGMLDNSPVKLMIDNKIIPGENNMAAGIFFLFVYAFFAMISINAYCNFILNIEEVKMTHIINVLNWWNHIIFFLTTITCMALMVFATVFFFYLLPKQTKEKVKSLKEKRKEKKNEDNPSLLSLYWKSIKNKLCYPVKYK